MDCCWVFLFNFWSNIYVQKNTTKFNKIQQNSSDIRDRCCKNIFHSILSEHSFNLWCELSLVSADHLQRDSKLLNLARRPRCSCTCSAAWWDRRERFPARAQCPRCRTLYGRCTSCWWSRSNCSPFPRRQVEWLLLPLGHHGLTEQQLKETSLIDKINANEVFLFVYLLWFFRGEAELQDGIVMYFVWIPLVRQTASRKIKPGCHWRPSINWTSF